MPVETQVAEPEVQATAIPVPDDKPADSVPPTDQTGEQEQPQVDQPEETEPESEPDLEESAEAKPFSEYKDVFKTHPELRTKVARENAFTELFPKFSDAKQLREWFPTQDDAERIVEDSTNLRTMQETFRSDPAGYMDSLRETDAASFQKLVTSLPSYLSQSDPDLYANVARPIVTTVFDNLFEAAQAAGDKALVAQLIEVAGRGLGITLGGYRPQRQDASTSEIERLRKQVQERDEADRERAFTTFTQDVDQQFVSRVQGEIAKIVDGSTFTDKVKTTIKKSVWESVHASINNQPAVRSEVERLFVKARDGKATKAEQSQLVESLVRRASSLIPGVYKTESAEWAKAVVKRSKEEIANKQRIAETTKDAGSGVGAGGAARPASAPRPPRQPRTAADILAEARSGTYVRK